MYSTKNAYTAYKKILSMKIDHSTLKFRFWHDLMKEILSNYPHHNNTILLLEILRSRPGQIYFGKMPQTPQQNMGKKVSAHQFLLKSNYIWPPLRSSEGFQVGLEIALSSYLRGFGGVVKRCWISIKISVHSPFSPSFPVEFEAFYQNKFGLA